MPVNGRAAVAAVGGIALQCAAGQGLSGVLSLALDEVLGVLAFWAS